MDKTTISLFTLANVLIKCLTLTDFASLSARVCDGVDYSEWSYTNAERSKLRNSSSTPISLSYDNVRQFLENNDYSAIIKGTAGYFSIIIILIVACLISFVFFALYCCCFKKYRKATEKKAKPFLLISAIFWVGFLGFFVTAIVYLGMIQKDYKNINCILYKVPADIMQGISGTDREYIGLRPLQDLLTAFTVEVNLMDSLKPQFDYIVNLNLKGNANSPIRALTEFYNNYDTYTTRDGQGFSAKPITIKSLTTSVSNEILSEFTSFSYSATNMTSAANIGISVGTNDREEVYLNSTKLAIEALNTTLVNVDAQFYSIADKMNKAWNYSVIAYFCGLGIGVAVIALSACLVIIMVCQSKKQRCMGKIWLIKTFLALIAFATFCFAILSALLLIATTAVSSYCNFQKDMLVATDVQFFINQYKIDLNPELLNIIGRCVTTSGDGSISSLLGLTESNQARINDIQTFYNGFIGYEKMFKNITSNDLDSVSILNQVAIWETYANGYNYDHTNVDTALVELNKLVSCGDIVFELNAARCPNSKKVCDVINTSTSYIIPPCSSNAARAQYLISVLQTYLSDEKNMITILTNALSSVDNDTAHRRFQTLKNVLQNANPYYQNVKQTLVSSFAVTSGHTTNFSDFISCKRIREEFEDYESVICFHANRDFYIFFVMIVCATFMLFTMNWFICIALRCVPDDTPITLKAHKGTDLSKIYFGDSTPIPI